MPIITPKIPDGLPELMRGLAKSVIKENPGNIYEFAADYFDNLLKKRDDGVLDKGYKSFTAYRVYSDYKRKMKTMNSENAVTKMDDMKSITEKEFLKSFAEDKDALSVLNHDVSKFDIKTPDMRSRKGGGNLHVEVPLRAISEEYEKIDEVVAAVVKIQRFYRECKMKRERKDNLSTVCNIIPEPDKETGELNEAMETKMRNDDVGQFTDEPNEIMKTTDENALDIDPNDPELNIAALKIQKTFRGHKVRKTNVSLSSPEESELVKKENNNNTSDVQFPNEDEKFDERIFWAVLSIQKYFRGYLVRKMHKFKNTDKSNHISCEPNEDELNNGSEELNSSEQLIHPNSDPDNIQDNLLEKGKEEKIEEQLVMADIENDGKDHENDYSEKVKIESISSSQETTLVEGNGESMLSLSTTVLNSDNAQQIATDETEENIQSNKDKQAESEPANNDLSSELRNLSLSLADNDENHNIITKDSVDDIKSNFVKPDDSVSIDQDSDRNIGNQSDAVYFQANDNDKNENSRGLGIQEIDGNLEITPISHTEVQQIDNKDDKELELEDKAQISVNDEYLSNNEQILSPGVSLANIDNILPEGICSEENNVMEDTNLEVNVTDVNELSEDKLDGYSLRINEITNQSDIGKPNQDSEATIDDVQGVGSINSVTVENVIDPEIELNRSKDETNISENETNNNTSSDVLVNDDDEGNINIIEYDKGVLEEEEHISIPHLENNSFNESEELAKKDDVESDKTNNHAVSLPPTSATNENSFDPLIIENAKISPNESLNSDEQTDIISAPTSISAEIQTLTKHEDCNTNDDLEKLNENVENLDSCTSGSTITEPNGIEASESIEHTVSDIVDSLVSNTHNSIEADRVEEINVPISEELVIENNGSVIPETLKDISGISNICKEPDSEIPSFETDIIVPITVEKMNNENNDKLHTEESKIMDELAEIQKIDNKLKNQNSAEALFYSLKKNELMVEKQQKDSNIMSNGILPEQFSNTSDELNQEKLESSPLDETQELDTNISEANLSENALSNDPAVDSENDNDDVVINTVVDTIQNQDNVAHDKPEAYYNPFVEAALKNESFLQQIHGANSEYSSPIKKSLVKSYTAVVPKSDDGEDEDQFDDYFVGNIKQKMMAYSISRSDSDFFDSSKATFADDNNIKTTLETILSTDSDSTIVSAATKIQAGARGFLTRRRLQSSTGTGTSNAVQASFGNAAIDQSLDDFIQQEEQIHDKNAEDAAIVIQRSYRHFMSNKYTNLSAVDKNSVSRESYEEYNYPGGVIEIKLEQKKIDVNLDNHDEMRIMRPQMSHDPGNTYLNVDEFDAATRRSMLHRENAVQRNSTPDDDVGLSRNVSTEKTNLPISGEKLNGEILKDNIQNTSESSPDEQVSG